MNFHTSSLSNLTPFATEFRESSSVVRGVAFQRVMKHGESRSQKGGTKEYRAWKSVKYRCYQKNNPKYKYYGQRGIVMCDAWLNDYPQFLQDVGRAPSPQHSLDRIDNDGNYEPGNVRWATMIEQRRNNRAGKKMITCRGKTMRQVDWSKVSGVDERYIHARLRNGWPIEEAIFRPVWKRGMFTRYVMKPNRSEDLQRKRRLSS